MGLCPSALTHGIFHGGILVVEAQIVVKDNDRSQNSFLKSRDRNIDGMGRCSHCHSWEGGGTLAKVLISSSFSRWLCLLMNMPIAGSDPRISRLAGINVSADSPVVDRDRGAVICHTIL